MGTLGDFMKTARRGKVRSGQASTSYVVVPTSMASVAPSPARPLAPVLIPTAVMPSSISWPAQPPAGAGPATMSSRAASPSQAARQGRTLAAAALGATSPTVSQVSTSSVVRAQTIDLREGSVPLQPSLARGNTAPVVASSSQSPISPNNIGDWQLV